MNNTDFDQLVIKNIMLFILKELGGKADYLRINKIMYFADQKHLVEWGIPISNDRYTAMKRGPVPSYAYTLMKDTEQNADNYPDDDDCFAYEPDHFMIAKQEPDIDYIPESGLEILLETIRENKDLSFEDLSEKSHDAAWHQTEPDAEMSLISIAKAAGASDAALEYIQECFENRTAHLR